jgi:hypothetical protein
VREEERIMESPCGCRYDKITSLTVSECSTHAGPEGRMKIEMQKAEEKAWDSLARYKFQMFGYWAAIWVHLNKISGAKRNNPFKDAVSLARSKR